MAVYDCFTFYNELNLLEIRLNELDSIVDHFVLVEATTTHSGKPKPLIFAENKERYSAYLDKIIHIVVDDIPDLINNNRWGPEVYQRRCISRSLLECNPEDIILVSDLDEIPDAKVVSAIVSKLQTNSIIEDWREYAYRFFSLVGKRLSLSSSKRIWGSAFRRFMVLLVPLGRIYKFRQRHHEYYLNGHVHNNWMGSTLLRFSTLSQVLDMDTNSARNLTGFRYQTITGGWHFSYLGGASKIVEKIHAFAHSEFDNDIYTDTRRIQERIDRGENLFGKEEGKHEIKYAEIDETYPGYIIKNSHNLKHLIKQ